MGCLKRLAVMLLALMLLLVLVAGYFGFVPGLSKAFGTGKPRDLGVRFSVEAGFQAAKNMNLPLTYGDLEKISKNPELAKSYNGDLSAEEVSSLLLLGQGQIESFPIYLTTVRFNPDNTAEAAGIIRMGNVGTFLQNTGVSKRDADIVLNTIKLVSDVPFYAKGKCEIRDNQVSIDISEIEIGRLPLPAQLIESNQNAVEDYIGNALSMHGFRVKNLSVNNGKAKLEGTRPIKGIQPWLKMIRG